MSSSLATTQRWLVQAITRRQAPRSLARLGGAQVAVGTGLDIYRHAYRARLLECLADDFPAVQSLLGEDRFAALAEALVRSDPPSEATLNDYGRRLLTHVRRHPASIRHGRLVYDLARLEWALVEAIHAPLAAQAAAGALAAIPATAWPQARLIAAPSLRIIASRWPVDGCYRQHLRGETVTPPTESQETVVVLRRSTGLERLVFDRAAGRLLGRLARGLPLGLALEGCRLSPAGLQSCLSTAWSSGLFTAITTDPP